MPCGKIRYRDRLAAEIALADIKAERKTRPRTETRAYKCKDCCAWHLTSREAKKRR